MPSTTAKPTPQRPGWTNSACRSRLQLDHIQAELDLGLIPPPRRPEPRQEPPRLCGDFAALHHQGVVPVIEVREMLVHPYPDRDLPLDLPHAAHIRHRPRRPSREQPICQRRRQPDPLPDLKLLHLAAPPRRPEPHPEATQDGPRPPSSAPENSPQVIRCRHR